MQPGGEPVECTTRRRGTWRRPQGVEERTTDLWPERRPQEVDLGDVAGEDLLSVRVLTSQDGGSQPEADRERQMQNAGLTHWHILPRVSAPAEVMSTRGVSARCGDLISVGLRELSTGVGLSAMIVWWMTRSLWVVWRTLVPFDASGPRW